MRTVLGKWGGSTGVRIPKAILEGLNLKEGEEVEIQTKGEVICIVPVHKKKELKLKLKYRNDFTPKELFDDMTPENCKLEWFENDRSRGKEIW